MMVRKGPGRFDNPLHRLNNTVAKTTSEETQKLLFSMGVEIPSNHGNQKQPLDTYKLAIRHYFSNIYIYTYIYIYIIHVNKTNPSTSHLVLPGLSLRGPKRVLQLKKHGEMLKGGPPIVHGHFQAYGTIMWISWDL